VTIDHVLAERGILFSEYRVEELKGSDHRAVFAELVIPPGELR
jgi:endonuclease/exonuclease/phosphatase (EEP) superfamily protein YafD